MINYILLFVFLFVILFLFFFNYNQRGYVLKRQLLTKDYCNMLIKEANKHMFETYNEPVDNFPVYEIDIFSEDYIVNMKMWEFIEVFYQKKIEPYVQRKYPNCILNFIFLRRYNNYERDKISIHTDDSELSINIMLSENKNYTGGEFYIFNRRQSNKYIPFYKKHLKGREENKQQFIDSFSKLPIIPIDQGDCIIYEGKKHLHGVLPVTSGVRYMISFFFKENKYIFTNKV